MNFNQFPTPEPLRVLPIDPEHKAIAEQFLGDARRFITEEAVDAIISRVTHEQKGFESIDVPEVTYNKHKKSFFIGTTAVTAGQLVASRHVGNSFTFSKRLDESFDGRKLRAAYTKAQTEDFIFDALNEELAATLAVENERTDALKSKAYAAIAERSGNGKEQNEQLGVVAEKIVHGVAEMISIDRPDLGITVHAANAYQDVEEKIDFIIATKQKRRGAGIEAKDLPPEEKHVGIQFTINTAKESFKKDQIAKAKERGIDLDDIVYVAIDSAMLRTALTAWEKAGKPVAGPWGYLPTETKQKALSALFHSVLTEEQEASLLKHI